MRVAAACVDSGGHHSEEVYRFCRENAGRRWYAVKGANTPGKALIASKSILHKPEGDVRLYNVGTETAKDTIANMLAVKEHGPGFCHFPACREESYFKQLRAERPTVRAGVRRWVKVRESARNEALDLRVYAMAALAILNPNWRVLASKARARFDVPPELRKKRCDNPECGRRVGGAVEYCCAPCRQAHEGKYEIHESGPLGHSAECEGRVEESKPAETEERAMPQRRGGGFVGGGVGGSGGFVGNW
jgi:phage terminase large subunit GpA-like protein